MNSQNRLLVMKRKTLWFKRTMTWRHRLFAKSCLRCQCINNRCNIIFFRGGMQKSQVSIIAYNLASLNSNCPQPFTDRNSVSKQYMHGLTKKISNLNKPRDGRFPRNHELENCHDKMRNIFRSRKRATIATTNTL